MPLRQIALHPTSGEPPVNVYDASGPYTDPQATIAIDQGLARHRLDWLKQRGDVEAYDGRDVNPRTTASSLPTS